MTNDQKIKKLAGHQEAIEQLSAQLAYEVSEMVGLHQEIDPAHKPAKAHTPAKAPAKPKETPEKK